VDESIQFLVQHGKSILFWFVFVEQIGLPLPAMPLLIAAGALAGAGKMSVAAAIGIPVMASAGPDLLWYYLGRTRGGQVLGILCRISLEPDSCIRRTENMFLRHGVRSLLVAKFVPGLSTVTPPLAGIVGMGVWRFLLYDGLGTFLWAGACASLGYLFSNQLEQVALLLAQTGFMFVATLIGALVGFIGYKYVQRQRVLRELRMARITVDELKQRLDAGEDVAIVDVRHPLDLEANPRLIPGAVHMPFEEIDQRHHEIPRDREIVVYCACPNEVSSARTALRLRRNGISRVRPLAGGLEAWRERNFPLELRNQPPAPD
jgi:membrane protein DedA with SNARE-associated domain/rhodanese-related sulfurtransferase